MDQTSAYLDDTAVESCGDYAAETTTAAPELQRLVPKDTKPKPFKLAQAATLAALKGPRASATATLNDSRNNTGRTAFCGPTVISAITGYSVTKVEDVIRANRNMSPEVKSIVVGTYSNEVEEALAAFGYRMSLVESFMHLERKGRPTLSQWMQKPRNAYVHYVLGIHTKKEGHWVLIKGVKLCDTYTEGRWTFFVDGPHRSCRIMEIFEVRKSVDA